MSIDIVSGTASSSPVAPSSSDIASEIGSGRAFVVLANITMTASASVITAGDIATADVAKLSSHNVDFTTHGLTREVVFNTSDVDKDKTIVMPNGQNLTVKLGSTGRIEFTGDTSSIKMARVNTTISYTSNTTGNPGFGQLISNSKYYTYSTGGLANGTAFGAGNRGNGTVDSSGYINACGTIAGNKSAFMGDYTVHRVSGDTWQANGWYGVRGTASIVNFFIEANSATVPTLYQRNTPSGYNFAHCVLVLSF